MWRVCLALVCVGLMATMASAVPITSIQSSHLQVYLPMNGDLLDASGNGNHASLYDGANGLNAFATGVSGQGLQLTMDAANDSDSGARSGDNDHVIIPIGLNNQNGTVAMWFYGIGNDDGAGGKSWGYSTTLWDTDNLADSGLAVGDPLRDPSANSWECWIDKWGLNPMAAAAGAGVSSEEGIAWGALNSRVDGGFLEFNPAPEVAPLDFGVWTHVAVTWEYVGMVEGTNGPYEAIEMRMYMNGELCTADLAVAPEHPTADAGDVLFLGGGNPSKNESGSRFDNCAAQGIFDQVAVWDTCLTAAEVKAAVPEPGTIVMLLAGAVAAALCFRKR